LKWDDLVAALGIVALLLCSSCQESDETGPDTEMVLFDAVYGQWLSEGNESNWHFAIVV
jgi:hypothetical protein